MPTRSSSRTQAPRSAWLQPRRSLAQLTALNLFALYLAQERGSMPDDKMTETIEAMRALPDQIEETLMLHDDVHRAAKRYAVVTDALFIGRGVGMAVAMEGALKLKEISYIHAEGYAAGELKHGAIALIEEGMPVVADPHRAGDLYDKMLANVQEVQSSWGGDDSSSRRVETSGRVARQRVVRGPRDQAIAHPDSRHGSAAAVLRTTSPRRRGFRRTSRGTSRRASPSSSNFGMSMTRTNGRSLWASWTR